MINSSVAKIGVKYASKKYKGKIAHPRKFAKNKALRKTLNEMYRPKGTVGDGSLATATRLEVKYGIKVKKALNTTSRSFYCHHL
ncbi:hypothetical protein [Bacillus sp. Hm123]|uniref:hypothetical protein n=1 Tax=Bacillus sp. Hm123 TaxID=3450745 RepID=UPI003F424088